jgi:RNA polymerase sigma-70 factor (ECF subfamily)
MSRSTQGAPDDPAADFAARHLHYLKGRALNLSRDPAVADDLVQDALERALKKLDTFDPGDSADPLAKERAWLSCILTRLFIDKLRASREVPQAAPQATAPSVHYEPSEWELITVSEVEAAVRELPDRFRVIFERFHFERQSYDEIASALGVAKNTVASRLARARTKVRAHLRKNRTS